MKGRIILSQADFSANNIGRYVELSDLTKKVLAKQTQYGEDSTEAAALNTFLNALTTEGFIGGESPLLKCLIIPGLANSHDELLYNIAKLDNDGYPTDVMAASEKSAEKHVYLPYVVDSKNVGVTRFANASYTESDANNQSKFNVDMFEYNTAYPSFSMCLFCKKANNVLLKTYTSSSQIKLQGNYVCFDYGNREMVKAEFSGNGNGFFGINFEENVGWSGVVAGGTIGETSFDAGFTPSAGSSNYNVFSLGRFAYGSYNFGLLTLGNFIPTEKMNSLKGYVDTLMTALHVSF